MAAQTVTTAVNYDDAAISGLLNGETITITGGALTINSDVRWNQQAAVFGSITMTSTSQGSLLVDGRDVWEIPFDASTGNVPTQNALGSNGVTGGTSGATGELLRVWTTGTITPTAAGGAMPASGFIKLRTKTGTFQDNEIITLPGGATVTVNSATGGQRSWIHAVGAEATTITASRLHTVEFQGDWYYLPDTNGTDDQTFQYPVADLCPAIQVETAAGSGIYEWWMYAGDRWGTATQFVDTDVRGKYFGQDLVTGIITIARRSSNACGYKPPSGCKVRIPNILLSSSTSANWNANTINATLVTRYDINCIGQPAVTIKYVSGPWYWNLQGAYSVDILNVTSSRSSLMTDFIVPSTIDGMVLCLDSGVSSTGFSLQRLLAGTTVKNCKVGNSVSTTSGASYTIRECDTFTIENCFAESFGTAGSQDKLSMVGYSFAQCFNILVKDCVCIGTRLIAGSSSNVRLENLQFASRLLGTTTAVTESGITCSGGCNGIYIKGFSNYAGLVNVHPRTNVLLLNELASNVIVEDIGTRVAPYDCGTVNGTVTFINFTNVQNAVCRNAYSINKTSASTGFSAGSNSVNVKWANVGAGYTATNSNNFGNDSVARGIQQPTPLSASGVTGTHWVDGFSSTTVGYIMVLGAEPTTASASQCQATLSATSGFTGTGSVAMPALNDEVIWEQPYFAIGHTGFSSLVVTGTNTANITLDFQYDTGSGWSGTWATLTSAALVALGAINPATGIKFKIRATTSTAAAGNAISAIRLATTSTATDQDVLYPDDPDTTGLVENLVAGSRIQIYNEDTSTEIFNGVVSGTSYTYEYNNGVQISSGDTIRIRVAKLGCLPQTLIAIATGTGFSAAANQQPDAVYNTNAIDGSSVTEFTADYPNVQIDISDPDNVTTVQRIYAFLRYTETTEDGIAQWFNALSATDVVNYEINTSVLDLKLDNTQPTPVVIGGGRLFRSDGGSVIATLSSSIQMDPQRVYSGSGGGVSAADIWSYSTRTLTSGAAPSASTIATAVRSELTTELGRIDVATSTRLATSGYTAPPTAAANATAVRSELSTELGRIDVATSTRLATAGYTVPPSVSDIRTEMDTNSTKLDVAVGTRLATSGYTAPPSAVSNATAVRSELSTELSRIDATVSSRALETTAQSIKTKTDNLPASPAATGDVPTASQVATQVRTELSTELGRIDVAVSTRNAIAPLDSSATQAAAAAALTSYDPPTKGELDAAEAAIIAAVPSAAANATAVRSELSTELSRVDATVSSRALETTAQAVKAKTDNLPAAPASEGKVQEAVDAAKLAVALSA